MFRREIRFYPCSSVAKRPFSLDPLVTFPVILYALDKGIGSKKGNPLQNPLIHSPKRVLLILSYPIGCVLTVLSHLSRNSPEDHEKRQSIGQRRDRRSTSSLRSIYASPTKTQIGDFCVLDHHFRVCSHTRVCYNA